MKKLLTLFTFLLVILFTLQAQARIYILIDELSERKFPIAVPSFLTPSGNRAGGTSKKIFDLMNKDLKIAGMFQILDDSILPQKDKDVDKIDFEKWKALEVGALVKGIVSKNENGSGEVLTLKLYDVADGSMILGKKYVITSKNYIKATHRWMDSLLQALTGIRGPFDSKIAASCGKNFKKKIMSVNMDNSERDGVIKSGINDISPSWSPDGSTLAYTSFTSKYPEIYVSGRKITDYKSTTLTPAWTADGHLVIASAFSGDTELYLVSRTGQMIRQITNTPNIDFNPTVSSSGRVVFSSERAGGLQLFATTLNGGGTTQLTYTGYQNDQPDWSPDGTKIVFSGKDRGAFDIFVMEANGSNILRLTREEGNNESPTWSPDSRYIAFASSRGGIYVMLEDGTNQTQIEKTDGCVNLDWGPWLSEE